MAPNNFWNKKIYRANSDLKIDDIHFSIEKNTK